MQAQPDKNCVPSIVVYWYQIINFPFGQVWVASQNIKPDLVNAASVQEQRSH